MERNFIEAPPLARVLSYGKKGDDVLLIQQILLDQGFFTGEPRGNFYELTDEAVRYFQNTHIDADGSYLKVDGIVGPKTWGALHNPSGSAQRSFIDTSEIEEFDHEPRLDILNWFKKRHAEGVKEVPDGSNYGDGVTAPVNACGFKRGIAWCLAEQMYAEKEVFGTAPFQKMHVHCSTFFNEASKWGKAFRRGRYQPIPGDIAIYNYQDPTAKILKGPGHAVRVARVSKDGKSFNTFGGNEGNRLKYGIRRTSESNLAGFVNLFGDEHCPPKFTPGVTHAPNDIRLTIASTR